MNNKSDQEADFQGERKAADPFTEVARSGDKAAANLLVKQFLAGWKEKLETGELKPKPVKSYLSKGRAGKPAKANP